MKIAISGKGGVGKTTIMAVLAGQFRKMGREVLIIDADPSPHMAQTLGLEGIDRITPICEMKDLLKERSGKTEGSPFYNINPKVDDIMADYMLEKDGIRLMVLGAIQTGGGGCACAENTVLRRLLTRLLLSPSQVVLIDMEAGVEHLGRGTIAGVDLLMVVVIPSQSGVRTARKIKKLALDVKIPRISYVGNLVADKDDESFLVTHLDEPPIAFFPDSSAVRKTERSGMPVMEAADDMNTEAKRLIDRLLASEKS